MIRITVAKQQMGDHEEHPGDQDEQKDPNPRSGQLVAMGSPAAQSQQRKGKDDAQGHDLPEGRCFHDEIIDRDPQRGEYRKYQRQGADSNRNVFRARGVEIARVEAGADDVLRIDALQRLAQLATQADIGFWVVVDVFVVNGRLLKALVCPFYCAVCVRMLKFVKSVYSIL